MKSLALLAVLACCLAPAAAAQFTQFSWTLDNPGGLFASLTAGGIGLSGGLGGDPDNVDAQYTTTSPVDALVLVHVKTQPLDGECGSTTAYFGAAHALSTATDCWYDENESFTVHAGEDMVFGLHVINGSFAGTVYYTNFIYRPFWLLGGALAGSAGTPALSGHGVLQAGEPFGIDLEDAAPGAATAIVLGASTANLPFKGGVLVPAPALIVAGLATDAQGALSVAGTWPVTPPGTAIVLQAWIADAGAPQGYAASNAVSAFGF